MSKTELISTVEARCILSKTNGDLRIEPCQPLGELNCEHLSEQVLCRKGISRNPRNILQCPLQRGVLTIISNNVAEK